jgi:hypothetical protein
MDEDLVQDTTGLQDGRLRVVHTQESIIDRMLVDHDGEVLSDENGNIITE